MIAFIEGGMTIPMGTITRNYLRFFRLSPTQCALNMFRVLGSIEALNEWMNLNLTHHNVNWVYNLHNLKGQWFYLKSRYPEVRLIQCLPTSNKNLKEDFLIFFGEWHDGLPCPIEEGEPGGGTAIDSWILVYTHFFFLSCVSIFLFLIKPHFNFNDFVDRRSTKPRLNLVNKASLDRVLQAEIYVNEADGQLWAAHLILGYTPLSFAFQAPKYVIRAHDPQLRRISVAYQGFVIPEGVPLPRNTPCTQPLFVATPSVGASSSQLVLIEEEDRRRRRRRRRRKPGGSCRFDRLLRRIRGF